MINSTKVLALSTKLAPMLAEEYDADVRMTALKVLLTMEESDRMKLVQEEAMRKAFSSGEETLLQS